MSSATKDEALAQARAALDRALDSCEWRPTKTMIEEAIAAIDVALAGSDGGARDGRGDLFG